MRATSTLLNAGANVDHADKDGNTPLFAASRYAEIEAMKTLHRAGADLNHVNKLGKTAFSMYGSGNRHVQNTLYKLAIKSPTIEEFVRADITGKNNLLRSSVSLRDFIVNTVDGNTHLGERDPYNISLDSFSDDMKIGMLFRYGSDTVASIYYTGTSTPPRVSFLQGATAPVCAGDGRVFYTLRGRNGERHVHENRIDLQGPGNPLTL